MKYVLIILLLFPVFAHAYLGETKAPQKNGIIIEASKAAKTAGSFTTQISSLDSVSITEYLNSDGKVFAVSWNGMSHPDLSVLLGNYWPEYQQQKRPSVRRLSKRVTSSGSIVVEKSGKMRDVSGHAYIRELLPEGFNLNDLQ